MLRLIRIWSTSDTTGLFEWRMERNENLWRPGCRKITYVVAAALTGDVAELRTQLRPVRTEQALGVRVDLSAVAKFDNHRLLGGQALVVHCQHTNVPQKPS
jgi:hypothetical protein